MIGLLVVIACLAGIAAVLVRWYYRGGGPSGYYSGDDAARVTRTRIQQNFKGRSDR